MEEFRPIIADSAAIAAINTGMVSASDFITSAAGFILRDTGRKAFIKACEARLDQLATHPLFDYRASWRSLIRVQARLIARWLRGDVPDYNGITTRQSNMRYHYVVTYDISDDRRRSRAFKLMHGFGDHAQYSVFFCELSDEELVRMRSRLRAEIHHGGDQVLIFELGRAARPLMTAAALSALSMNRRFAHLSYDCERQTL